MIENQNNNMTPKEKAEKLVVKMSTHDRDIHPHCTHYIAKQCAIIAVDEIIKSSPSLPILGDGGTFGEDIELSKKYWQEVKQEIEKI